MYHLLHIPTAKIKMSTPHKIEIEKLSMEHPYVYVYMYNHKKYIFGYPVEEFEVVDDSSL